MLQDPDRYFLTTGDPTVMQNVLSFVSARDRSEGALAPEAIEKDRWEKMILELRRPKEAASVAAPEVTNIRTSHIGRVLVVTGDATAPEILDEIDALRHPQFSFRWLTSGLLAFGRTIFCSLWLADPQN
jgi:hypothetical protein